MAERINLGEEGVALSPEEAQRAFGALQELMWRAVEGDGTAQLSEEEEALRLSLQQLLHDGAYEHVPWSRREGNELAADLRRLMAESAHGAPYAVPVFTEGAVRSLLTRYYNRSEEEANEVVRTWLEVLRGGSVPRPLYVIADGPPGPGAPRGIEQRDLVARLRRMVPAVEQGVAGPQELGLLLREAATAVELVSCQFVELEDAEGHGVGPSSGVQWEPDPAHVENGRWRLGPFGVVSDGR